MHHFLHISCVIVPPESKIALHSGLHLQKWIASSKSFARMNSAISSSLTFRILSPFVGVLTLFSSIICPPLFPCVHQRRPLAEGHSATGYHLVLKLSVFGAHFRREAGVLVCGKTVCGSVQMVAQCDGCFPFVRVRPLCVRAQLLYQFFTFHCVLLSSLSQPRSAPRVYHP